MSARRLLRLAAVSDAVYPWHRGGKELRYHELLGRLPERGVEVDLYTMRWWDGDAPAAPVRHHAISPRLQMYRDGRRTIGQGVRFALATLRLLRAPRPDVFEADHMPYLQLFPLAVVCRLRRVPLVVTWHEVWGGAYWRRYMGRAGGTVAAVVERLSLRLPHRIVAVSEPTAARLRELGVPAERLVVIEAGIRREAIRAQPPADGAPDVLSLGRLIGHKRTDLAIRAIALLPGVCLGVVGSGEEREALEALAASLGVADRVAFLGAVATDEEVYALLRGARVLAAPTEREGFGIAVAEALSAGLPVVTSDHPDNAARVLVEPGVTGDVVAAGDEAALAAALARWLDRADGRADREARFDATLAHLAWDATADRYAALLHEVAR